MNPQNTSHRDFTIFDIATCIRRNWWRSALVVLIVGVAARWVTSYYTPYYRSTDASALVFQSSYVNQGLHQVGAVLGYDLGNVMTNTDAIDIRSYIESINSTEMMKRIMQTKVTTTDGTCVDYYTHLQKNPQPTLLDNLRDSLWTSSRPRKDTLAHIDDVSPHALTPYEDSIFSIGRKRVQFISAKSISYISVFDTDPAVCASLASQLQKMYKTYMTDYRVGKNRMDSAFYASQADTAYRAYVKASKASIQYHESHNGTLMPSVEREQENLDNEAEQRYREYVAINVQCMQSAALIQDRTPAVIDFQPATTPNNPEGPKRGYITLMSMLLAFLISIMFFLRKQLWQMLR